MKKNQKQPRTYCVSFIHLKKFVVENIMQTQRSRKSSGLKGIEVRNEWCRDGLKMFIGEIDVREKTKKMILLNLKITL